MRVDEAKFEFLEQAPLPRWAMRVKVSGEGFEPHAAPLRALVGDELVEGILPNLDADGFIGYLHREPPAGASLVVGYLDGSLIETDIEYEPPVG
jgi:hypothetical protein